MITTNFTRSRRVSYPLAIRPIATRVQIYCSPGADMNAEDKRSELNAAYDRIVNRIVFPILRHRDQVSGCCGDRAATLEEAMMPNEVIAEVRDIAVRELSAVHFGVCHELCELADKHGKHPAAD